MPHSILPTTTETVCACGANHQIQPPANTIYDIISKETLFETYKPIPSPKGFCFGQEDETGEEVMYGMDINDPIYLKASRDKTKTIWSVMSEEQIYLLRLTIDPKRFLIVYSGFLPNADAYLVCENECHAHLFVEN